MKVVGITLIVYHTDLALVFRHEHVNITIQWITMVSTTDYLTYTLSLASHVEVQEDNRSYAVRLYLA